MIVAISRFRPPPSDAARLVEQFQARTRAVDGHPGFLGLEVLLRGLGDMPGAGAM